MAIDGKGKLDVLILVPFIFVLIGLAFGIKQNFPLAAVR
tara:strand:- start:167 stop:283 length:117 start_codon:yes stop_codon:yes gene_type:complete